MVLTKKNYFQRTTRPKGPRTNDRIRAPEVQVISSDKKHLGTFPIKEAVEPKAIKTRETPKANKIVFRTIKFLFFSLILSNVVPEI